MYTKIKEQIKKIERLIIRLCVIYFGIGLIGFFIPMGLLPKAGRRIHGRITEPLPEQIGVANYIIVMLLICTIICIAVLYFNKYFDLKEDLQEQRQVKFSTIITKVLYSNSDFGEPEYNVWLSQNRYDINRLSIPSYIKDSDKLTKGQEVEFILTANAYLPLELNILTKYNSGITKKSLDDLLKKIDQMKNNKK